MILHIRREETGVKNLFTRSLKKVCWIRNTSYFLRFRNLIPFLKLLQKLFPDYLLTIMYCTLSGIEFVSNNLKVLFNRYKNNPVEESLNIK